MATLKFQKSDVLPGTFEASTVYMLSDTDSNYMQFYLSNAAGSAVRRLPTKADIDTAINTAVAAYSNSVVVADITARDALNPVVVTIALVIDATDDSTVTSGSATYVFDPADDTWTKIAEHESMDLVTEWDNIQNKPSSSVAAIDAAVAVSHTHANKLVLDDLSEDASNNLMYNSEYIDPVLRAEDW